jgi:hypothetical protein
MQLSPSTIRRRARAGLLRPYHPPGRPARFILPEVLASRSRDALPPPERHICLFVREISHFNSALLAQISGPLADGANVLLVLDQAADRRDSLLSDPAVRHADREGHLRILEADALYLTEGHFDAARLLDRLTQLSAELGCAGRPLVMAGEMAWATRQHLEDEAIVYELALHSWLSRQPGVTLICIYDASHLNGEMALAALQAHPTTCVDGVCRTGLGRL